MATPRQGLNINAITVRKRRRRRRNPARPKPAPPPLEHNLATHRAILHKTDMKQRSSHDEEREESELGYEARNNQDPADENKRAVFPRREPATWNILVSDAGFSLARHAPLPWRLKLRKSPATKAAVRYFCRMKE